MSVTDTKLEYAIEIDCTDSTSATLESVGLYGGYFRFVTGYADNYDSKTWTTGLLVDGGIDRASVAIDLSETGGYSPDGSFGFVIAGSTNIVDYLDTYQIKLIGRTVRVWAAVGASFVPVWAGIVDTYGESDSGFQFACTVDFKARHKTIPPNVTDSGDVIPVVLGRVSKSPTSETIGISGKIQGKDFPVYTTANNDTSSDIGIAGLELADYAAIIEAIGTGDVFFQISRGAFDNSWMSSDILYKIKMVSLPGYDTSRKWQMIFIIDEDIEDIADVNNYYVDPNAYRNGKAWFVSIYSGTLSCKSSNDNISEYNSESSGNAKAFEYSSDQYLPVKVKEDLTDNQNLTVLDSGTGGSFVQRIALFDPISTTLNILGGNSVVQTKPNWLDMIGDGSYLFDRDPGTWFGVQSNANFTPGVYTSGATTITLLAGIVDVSKLNVFADDFFYKLFFKVYSQYPVIFNGTISVRVSGTSPYINSTGQLPLQTLDGFAIDSDLNSDYNTIPVEFWSTTPPASTKFLSQSYSVNIGCHQLDSVVIDAIRNGDVTDLYFRIDISDWYMENAYYDNVFSIQFPQVCLVSSVDIDTDGGRYYVDVEIGEGDVVSVPDAAEYIVAAYDGIVGSDFTDIASRSTWPIGRTLTERKSSAEYLDELCRNAFMVGYVLPENLLTFRTWIDNTTPVYAFNGNNIVRDSITDWNYSPISTVYNDIAAFAGYDYAASEFRDVYKITNTNEASFPLESGDWQKYVVGQSDYATALSAWEKARAGVDQTGVVQILPSSIGELPWFRAEAATTVDSAWEFTSLCAYWLSVQKLGCQFSASINSATLAIRLADPITVSDPIYSNNVALLGWITGIDIDRDAKEINYTVQFAPIVAEESYIYETGTAPNTITETGDAPDTITEGA